MSAQDDRLRAGRAVFARIVADDVAAVVARVREDIEPNLRPGERIAAELPDGTVIGSVTRSKVAQRAAVTDMRALLAWVREHQPDELVQSVNPAYVDALKRQVKVHGKAFDRGTGEVIPGVELVDGSATYRPAPDPDMVPLVLARLAELVGAGLLELPNPETESNGGASA